MITSIRSLPNKLLHSIDLCLAYKRKTSLKILSETNALAYFGSALVTKKKMFIRFSPEAIGELAPTSFSYSIQKKFLSLLSY